MPYASQSAKNTWRTLDRAKRALRGICRDCSRTCKRTRRQTLLCDYCYMKAYQRRPDALADFNLLKRQLRMDAMPLRDDRRRNGKAHHALAWALMMKG